MSTPLPQAAILLVEDNPGDARLMQEALRLQEVTNPLYVVGDGVEAMAFLRRRGQYADAPRPVLIILDLNLPKKDGREVLADIKADEDLKHIPVIVLSGSDSELDVSGAYQLHANSFVVKPGDLSAYVSIAGAIKSYWLTVARIRPRDNEARS